MADEEVTPITPTEKLEQAIDAIRGLVTTNEKLHTDWVAYNDNLETLIISLIEQHGDTGGVDQTVIDDLTASITTAFQNADTALQSSITNAFQAADEIVSKRTEAISPPVKNTETLFHILSDYPTLKKTDVVPTESPNNVRQILFDDVRGQINISLADKWFGVPDTITSRKFAIFWRGCIIRLNSAYSGDITMRVYPMGAGGNGLPDNPTLADHQWHTVTANVTNLYKIGEFNSEYFEGIIDYIELDNGWATLDSDHSYYRSLNGYFDVAFGSLRSPFNTFYQKADGFWYSDDVTPQTPYSLGASWTQDADDFRLYNVDNADGSNDALRFFGDGSDDYSFEIILVVHEINRDMAVTISNSAPNMVYGAQPYRFTTEQERIYFKRQNNAITGSMTVESIKMMIPVS